METIHRVKSYKTTKAEEVEIMFIGGANTILFSHKHFRGLMLAYYDKEVPRGLAPIGNVFWVTNMEPLKEYEYFGKVAPDKLYILDKIVTQAFESRGYKFAFLPPERVSEQQSRAELFKTIKPEEVEVIMNIGSMFLSHKYFGEHTLAYYGYGITPTSLYNKRFENWRQYLKKKH